MIISGHFFLLYFFPIFISAYYLFGRSISIKNILIIIASLFFYASFGIENLPILIIPLILDYVLAIFLFKTKKKIYRKSIVMFAVIINLGILVYFKYSNFVSGNLLNFFPSLVFLKFFSTAVVAPLGISFITFQRISYIVDIYRKSIKPATNFLQYATYACLFPHLISGPIVRFFQVKNQLAKRIIDNFVIFEASKYFVIGLAFKILIADQLFILEDLFSQSLLGISTTQSILLLIYFSMRIYFDFLGYSFMAIGLAKFLGFDFPQNFSAPYQSKSITEFWRRWNITLSNWLRDYLYIPMGGNRKGELRTYINLFTTMFLAGLWHGANWNFVIWGSLHGTYLVIERIFSRKGINFYLPAFVKVSFTFALLTLTWIIFKFTKLSDIWLFIKSLLSLKFVPLGHYEKNVFVVTIPSLIFAFFWSFKLKETDIDNIKPKITIILFLIALFFLSLVFSLVKSSVPFIYLQF